MQRNFYTDEFEQLIRQKADQYKMYPSDHVWKGVHKALHGRRRWYWAGMAVLLMSAGVFTTDYILHKPSGIPSPNKLQSSINTTNEVSNSNEATEVRNKATENSIAGNPLPELVSRQTTTSLPVLLMEHSQKLINEYPVSTAPHYLDKVSGNEKLNLIAQFENEFFTASETVTLVPLTAADAGSESAQKKSQQVNWLEEYAVYQLTPTRHKRMGWMLYFSPTINYRKLTGSNAVYSPVSEIQSVPLARTFNGTVDQYVHHKPALGFELGSNFLYRTSKHLHFKAGIQFNYSRYNIEAYSSHPEKATIALNSYANADTIVSYTSVRNMSGYAQQELSNQYFQLSLPVGVEVRLFGNEKIQLNLAGTVQPTYLLNRNSYLITTDYKNYTKEPSLVRRWNINAGVETYVAYNTGTVRWQLGPQFRYQLLSSYINKYPIKEYLMEYGFKIGVSKTIR